MREWESFTNQKQWKAYLQKLLKENDNALYAATLVIYGRQTDEEAYKAKSIEENGKGFTKIDARELTPIAKKIKSKVALTQHEYCVMKAKMPKYWKQLMYVSKEKMVRRQEEERAQIEQAKKAMATLKIENDIESCKNKGISCDYGICSECECRLEGVTV